MITKKTYSNKKLKRKGNSLTKSRKKNSREEEFYYSRKHINLAKYVKQIFILSSIVNIDIILLVIKKMAGPYLKVIL